jgi:putative colanic acid biosynthesis UDP-glucose lipid carrier transferase
LSYCEQHCIRFLSIPDIRNYLKRQMNLEFFGNVPVLYMREDPLAQVDNRFFKRAFDVIVSLLFMIPFWLIIYPLVALITKLTSPGPVFFKQQRNGLGGKVFYCYKFRSMRVNADSDRLQATANDPRKTKFGEFLRHTSIDELPQFINVLKGEMSIVGPRPHMVKHTQEYSALIDKYMVRHWVKPGITGWAQVNGARGETKRLSQMEDRIVKDVWYIEHWSFWLDLKIIFLTVYNALRGDKQAY